MTTFESIEEAREFFNGDKFAAKLGILHKLTVGLQVSINYLSGAKGEKLIAKATVRKDGRTTSVINVDITDDTGREIAQFVGTGYKM